MYLKLHQQAHNRGICASLSAVSWPANTSQQHYSIINSRHVLVVPKYLLKLAIAHWKVDCVL